MERGESFSRFAGLSARERQVLKLAAEGQTDAMICRSLGLAACTIGTYWSRIRQKTGLTTRGSLTAMYERHRCEGQLLRTVALVAESYRVRPASGGATKALFESLPVAALIVDPEGCIVAHTGHAARALSGGKRKIPLRSLLPEQAHSFAERAVWEACSGGRSSMQWIACPTGKGTRAFRIVFRPLNSRKAVLVFALP